MDQRLLAGAKKVMQQPSMFRVLRASGAGSPPTYMTLPFQVNRTERAGS
jgi:hypothetical protein